MKIRIPSFEEFIIESISVGKAKFEDFPKFEAFMKKKSPGALQLILDFFEGNTSLLYYAGGYSNDFENALTRENLGAFIPDKEIDGDFSIQANTKFEAWGYRTNSRKKHPAYLMFSLEGKRGIIVRTDFVKNEFINESENLDESIALAAVGGTLAIVLAAIGLSAAQEIKDRGGWKTLWNNYKEDVKLQKIVNRLKMDQDIITMMDIPESDRDKNWRDVILRKLTPSEIQYTKNIYDHFEEF